MTQSTPVLEVVARTTVREDQLTILAGRLDTDLARPTNKIHGYVVRDSAGQPVYDAVNQYLTVRITTPDMPIDFVDQVLLRNDLQGVRYARTTVEKL